MGRRTTTRLLAAMVARRSPSVAIACGVTLAACVALAGCGDEEPGVDEPAREGLAIPVGDVDYNVFITRQLNFNIVPDRAYYKGPPAARGSTFYGVFIQACNESEEAHTTVEDFKVVDNQGTEFEPTELPEDNIFAYRPRELRPGECIPEVGSITEQSPTAGSLLLFELPLSVTENRPLDLELTAPLDIASGKREVKEIELDL